MSSGGTAKLPAPLILERALPEGALRETGLSLPARIKYDDWAKLGIAISRSHRILTWALGDWLRYGEAEYGETYAQGVDATGYDPGYLSNLASVCERIGESERRPGLSFSHHQAVSYLEPEERTKLLDRAEKGGWDRDRMRLEAQKAGGTTGKNKSHAGVAIARRSVKCPKCGHEWRPR